MARNYGKIPYALYQSRITESFSYPAVSENVNLSGLFTLPTSEPATSQIIYTFGSNYMVTCSNPYSLIGQSPFLFAIGQNTSASTVTLSYRILKNGVSIYTSTQSVSASYYFIITAYEFLNVNQGDTLEIRLWANTASGLNCIETAIMPGLSRYIPMGKQGRLLLNFSFTANLSHQTLSRANFLSSGSLYAATDDNYYNSNHRFVINTGEQYIWKAFVTASPSCNPKLFWLSNGDSSLGTYCNTSSSLSSGLYYYAPVQILNSFTYTPTNIFP